MHKTLQFVSAEEEYKYGMKFPSNLALLAAVWHASTTSFAKAQTNIGLTLSGGTNFDRLTYMAGATPGAFDYLQQTNQATLFAPSDDAFEKLDLDVFYKLMGSAFEAQRRDWLHFHLIDAQVVSAADVVDGGVIPALNGNSLSFAKSETGIVTINGVATVITPDLEATNGVIHIIDTVLLPSWYYTTIYEIVVALPDISILIGLLNEARFDVILNRAGPYTLFAPTNAAFTAAFENNPHLEDFIKNEEFLLNLLSYHLVADTATVEELVDLTELPTALFQFPVSIDSVSGGAGEPIITIDGTSQIIGGGPIFANNGFIYLIDNILTPPSAMDTILGMPETYSTLIDLVTRAELDGVLGTRPNITVFAPSNDAFSELLPATVSKLTTTPFKSHLQDVILHHVYFGGSLLGGQIAPIGILTAANMDSLVFSRPIPGQPLVINDIAQLSLEMVAFNPAIVHAIDAVLMPSWINKTLLTIAESHGGFSTLLQLTESLGFNSTLNGEGPFTVFAPSDAAFVEALANSPNLTDAFTNDSDLMKSILTTHVVPGVVAVTDIDDGMELTSLSGKMLTFRVADDGTVTVNRISIKATDVFAHNGIIHVLGGVILPEGFEPPTTNAPVAVTTTPVVTTGAPVATPTSMPVATTNEPVATPTVAPTTSGASTFVGSFMAFGSGVIGIAAAMVF